MNPQKLNKFKIGVQAIKKLNSMTKQSPTLLSQTKNVQINPSVKMEESIEGVLKQYHFLRKIQYYAEVCKLAYSDREEFDQVKYDRLKYHTQPIFFNEGKTQVYSFITREIIENKIHDQLIVCFRGTDQVKDWYSNFNARKIPLMIKGKQYGKVHKGFYQYVQPAQEFIEDQITEFLGENNTDIIYEQSILNKNYLQENDLQLVGVEKNIIFCGHSLGGSCVIPALQVSLMDKVYCPVKVITFGSPRIGNREFTDWVDRHLPINVRIVNKKDIVPNLPSRLFFKHTPYMIHLMEESYEVRRQGDKINFLQVFKFLYDMFLNIKMTGIVYLFNYVRSHYNCVENHFMNNYMIELEKNDL